MKNDQIFRSEKNFGIVLADVMISFSALILILFSLISYLPHKNEDSNTMPGRLCAEIYWDNKRDVDLDLWGMSPLGIRVGYTNPHSPDLDLLRDVIGFSNNPERLNMEIICAHDLYPGEYTFDVNYYSDHESGRPPDPNHDFSIDVKMIVRIKNKTGTEYTKITSWRLTHEQEDKTMFDFVVDQNGNIKENSINSVNKYLAHVPKTSGNAATQLK